MRVAFAGTPEFAARSLRAIAGAGHDLPLVLTQPDRPAGRGLKLTPSAVSREAQDLGLPVEKPATLRAAEGPASLRRVAPDVLVVAAYGLLLPQEVLDIPRFGCLNVHASLLPRWRGAAPIQRAILAGDPETGISIMQMDAGLDTGPVLLAEATPIGPQETAGSLHDRLAELGAACIIRALARLGDMLPERQDESRATYAPKITKADTRIEWAASAIQAERQVRAFDPAPGAEATIEGEVVKVWRAVAGEGSGAPGQVLPGAADRLRVACGEGVLEVLEIQRPGGRRMHAADFLRGRRERADNAKNISH